MWSKGHRLELSKIRQVRRSVMIVLQFVSLELQQTLTNVIRKHGNPFPSELRRCSLLRPRMVSSLCCPAVKGPANGQDWYQTLQLFLRIGIQGESRQPETEWVSSSFFSVNSLTFMCSAFLLQESLNEILKLIPFSRSHFRILHAQKKTTELPTSFEVCVLLSLVSICKALIWAHWVSWEHEHAASILPKLITRAYNSKSRQDTMGTCQRYQK